MLTGMSNLKRTNMKKVLLMLSVLLSCGLFCACSSDSAESIDVYGTMNGNHEKQGEENENPTAVLGDINVLQVQSDNGDSEICLLDQPYYRGGYEELRLREDGSTYFVNHIIFTAFIRNSSLFDVLHIDIESGKIEDISGLKVGYTFESDKIRFEARDDSPVDGVVPVRVVPDYALGGQIQVVDKKIAADGKPYITLNIQNLKFHSSDLNRTFTLNATVDYEIDNNGYGENVDLEALLIPDEQLVFFMMDALNNEYQGRHMLFSDGPEEQECLIINSEQEFQDAYKGDWQLPSINFKYCTLVIGRTYGEHGGISLGDYELIDNGDTYQLNLTLNNNVNPNYTYTLDHVNLYFWKLYPKMENKPVNFNSTTQDVNLDSLFNHHFR